MENIWLVSVVGHSILAAKYVTPAAKLAMAKGRLPASHVPVRKDEQIKEPNCLLISCNVFWIQRDLTWRMAVVLRTVA